MSTQAETGGAAAASDVGAEMSKVVMSPLGVDGVHLRFGTGLSAAANQAALAFRAALEADPTPAMQETAAGLISVYVRFDPSLIGYDEMAAHLSRRLSHRLSARDWGGGCATALAVQGRRWRVPVVFGGAQGPDLDALAADRLGMDPAAAVASLTGQSLRVQAIGFAPGQPYLGQLSPEWDIPRRSDLTPQVPAGALVVAIRQVVIFSVPSPTGWWWIGRTGLDLFRPDRDPPFLLSPADELCFFAVDEDEMADRIATGRVIEGGIA